MSKKEKLLYGVGQSEMEFCVCGVRGVEAGEIFCIVGACMGIRSRRRITGHILLSVYGLFTHGKENIHNVAWIHKPLGILTCRFRHRRYNHEHALTRVRAGHRDSAVGRDIDSLAVLRPRLWNFYIFCRCSKISLAQRIRNSTYDVML